MIFYQLNQMILKTTLGQYWDSQNPCDEASYWRVTRSKSSPYFGTSFYVGAMMSGSAEVTAQKFGEMGELYGEMIQINDDLNDVLEAPANADWLQGRYPLPILFATLVPHPEQTRFVELRGQVGDEGMLRQAQEILIRSGAISYGIDQLLRRAARIHELLAQTPTADRMIVEQMVEGVIAPVRNLLAQVSGAKHGTVSAVG